MRACGRGKHCSGPATCLKSLTPSQNDYPLPPPPPSLFFCFVFFFSILFVLSSRSERLEQATKRLPALSELDQLLEYNASKNRFLWNERNGQRIRLQNFIENRTIAVNKDQEDDDAIALINCVYKFTMCRLQDTIRDPGFLL